MIEEKIHIQVQKEDKNYVAAIIVQKATNFQSRIEIINGKGKLNAKSMLGVILLLHSEDTNCILRVEGPDEIAAMATLSSFLKNMD